MSDRLSDIYPIPVQFVPGQQPTAAFLNAWADQIDLAFEIAANIIGDFYSQDTIIRGAGLHGNAYITNLTRTIGNTGWLNSLLPPGIEGTIVQEFVVPVGERVREFELFFPTSDLTSIVDTHAAANTLSQANRIDFADMFPVNGTESTWMARGKVIRKLGRLTEGIHAVTYDINTGTDSYKEKYAQTSGSCLVPSLPQIEAHVPAGGGTSLCTIEIGATPNEAKVLFPEIEVISNPDMGVWSVSLADSIHLAGANNSIKWSGATPRYRIPEWIFGLAHDPSGLLPQGLVAIWHFTENTIQRVTQPLEGEAQFFVLEDGFPAGNNVNNRTCIRVVLPADISFIEGGHYILTFAGTSISEALGHTHMRMLAHSHSGDDESSQILMSDIKGRFDNTRHGFSLDVTPDNYLPQYLHRYGYSVSDTRNNRNALLGDLLIARSGIASSEWGDSNSEDTAAADSYALRFGSYVSGPRLRWAADRTWYITSRYFVLDSQDGAEVANTTSPTLLLDSGRLLFKADYGDNEGVARLRLLPRNQADIRAILELSSERWYSQTDEILGDARSCYLRSPNLQLYGSPDRIGNIGTMRYLYDDDPDYQYAEWVSASRGWGSAIEFLPTANLIEDSSRSLILIHRQTDWPDLGLPGTFPTSGLNAQHPEDNSYDIPVILGTKVVPSDDNSLIQWLQLLGTGVAEGDPDPANAADHLSYEGAGLESGFVRTMHLIVGEGTVETDVNNVPNPNAPDAGLAYTGEARIHDPLLVAETNSSNGRHITIGGGRTGETFFRAARLTAEIGPTVKYATFLSTAWVTAGAPSQEYYVDPAAIRGQTLIVRAHRAQQSLDPPWQSNAPNPPFYKYMPIINLHTGSVAGANGLLNSSTAPNSLGLPGDRCPIGQYFYIYVEKYGPADSLNGSTDPEDWNRAEWLRRPGLFGFHEDNYYGHVRLRTNPLDFIPQAQWISGGGFVAGNGYPNGLPIRKQDIYAIGGSGRFGTNGEVADGQDDTELSTGITGQQLICNGNYCVNNAGGLYGFDAVGENDSPEVIASKWGRGTITLIAGNMYLLRATDVTHGGERLIWEISRIHEDT